jgi:6-phosphogluconolactonase (cycloisomerase 2 family)
MALCMAGGVHAAVAEPVLTTVGPPFATGDGPTSVAFGPQRSDTELRLLATANALADSVSVFSVSASGVLTSLGTPAATGSRPNSVAFSSTGRLLATADAGSDQVSMFTVSAQGALTRVAGAPGVTGDEPYALAFSPDARLLATANRGGDSVSVFSVAPTGELSPVGSPVPTGEAPISLAFSGSRALLATANSVAGSVSLFAVGGGGVLTAVGEPAPAGGQPQSVAFSRDGALLATAGSGSDGPFLGSSITMYSVPAAGALQRISTSPGPDGPSSLSFSPHDDFLAITAEGSVFMHAVSAVGELDPIRPSTPTGNGPRQVAFDPVRRLLAVVNSEDDSVSMFSISVRGVLTPIGAPAPTGSHPCSVQFSPAGGMLATANAGGDFSVGGTVSMFAISDGGAPQAIDASTFVNGRPCSLAFSPDGRLLATADVGFDAVSMFSVAPDGVLSAAGTTPGGSGSTDAVAFSSDGSLLATTNAVGSSVSVFSVTPGGALTLVDREATPSKPVSVAFRPDGRLLVTANRLADSLSVYSVAADGALTPVGVPRKTGGSPQSLAFSADGRLLATTDDKSVWLFSMSDDGVLTPVDSPRFLASLLFGAVAFSPSGELLAVASDERLWLFAVSATGSLAQIGAPTPIARSSSVAFSSDGKLIATANEDAATVSVHPLAAPRLAVAITTPPFAMSPKTTVGFEFEANYPSILECRLDFAPWEACTTSTTQAYAGLAEGVHTFAVHATDLTDNGGEVDALSWTVDRTAPIQTSLAQPADRRSDLRASPTFEWFPTIDELTGVDRYELWVDGAPRRTIPAESCDATCSAAPADPLADGSHSWYVRAVDRVGNAGVSSSRSFSVDRTPPGVFALAAPADDALTTSRRPELSWQAAVDSGIGLSGYSVVVDDQIAESGLAANATSFRPTRDLADGPHSWRVVASDMYGNERSSATGRFTVDTTPPVVAVTAAPNPALTGRSITFDAGGSTDPASGVARFEWDLDGDGSYETDAGAARTAKRSYAEPGTYVVSVRVTDRVGLSATGRIDQRVTTAGSTGPLGVSINDRAHYTRSPKVTITATWPLFASDMLISNDGGFGVLATLPLSKKTPWTLDSSGAERSTRLVYVRFRRGLTTSETYTDDIILDESRPSVASARVTLPRAARAPVLTLRARDRGLAGVGGVQVTNDRRRPLAKYRAYRAKVKLVNQPGYRRLNVRRTLYVRVRDRAGNVSAWRTVKRGSIQRTASNG